VQNKSIENQKPTMLFGAEKKAQQFEPMRDVTDEASRPGYTLRTGAALLTRTQDPAHNFFHGTPTSSTSMA